MLRCARCNDRTPRLTVEQTRCPACQRQVEAIIAADERRRGRFPFAKETTWQTGGKAA